MAESTRRAPIEGRLISVGGPPVIQHPRGRVCDDPDCSTQLSVYNPGTRCAIHEDGGPVGYLRMRRAGMPN